MRTTLIAVLMIVLGGELARAQINADVLGAHSMSPVIGAPITGTLGEPCMYCHAPHSGNPGSAATPLWTQRLSSVQSYQMYSSPTMVNQVNSSPPLGSNSTLCLSCHDGTVALGTTTPWGQVPMSGSLSGTPADLGTNLQTTHPFSFVTPLQSAPDLWPSLSATPPSTRDTTSAVTLINGNVECGSCHNPHVENIDPNSEFLVINNSEGALCLACHNTVPSGSGMGMSETASAVTGAHSAIAKRNPLASWLTSSHAMSNNRIAGQVVAPAMTNTISRKLKSTLSLGPYTTIRKNACLSCHQSHNSAKELLRGTDDQACLTCHNGGQNVSPPAPNVWAEMTGPKIGHASLITGGNAAHSGHEPDLLNHNRHANCVDCHNPHAAKPVGESFPLPPLIRASQSNVAGVSALDGRSSIYPAQNQFENCLRCHGTSAGKTNPAGFGYLPERVASSSDPLNVLTQMNLTSRSSHPVMHDRSSPFPQPSLRAYIKNLDGVQQGRSMGVRILCTDCHNSDDNREFGGKGPNGPHGSNFPHILERRYDMNRASFPGQLISNLNYPPNLSTTGNYALCAKCHDLNNVVSNSSFREHARHINDGFSCSVCHAAHGTGSHTATVSGERLVDFDINIVASNGRSPITYQRATNSCSLTCHGHAHSAGPSLAGGTIHAR